jgi:hypothetical protein
MNFYLVVQQCFAMLFDERQISTRGSLNSGTPLLGEYTCHLGIHGRLAVDDSVMTGKPGFRLSLIGFHSLKF